MERGAHFCSSGQGRQALELCVKNGNPERVALRESPNGDPERVALQLSQGTAGPRAAACDPVGNVQFTCGVIAPEDLVVVPRSDWVIASGDAAGGAIKAINVRDRTATALFPTETPRLRQDARTYDSCPGPSTTSSTSRPRRFRSETRSGSGRCAAIGSRVFRRSRSVTIHAVLQQS